MQMETGYSISIYLDTRRQKANGCFPVKLRVYSPMLGRTKLYPTVFNLTQKEFQSVWETQKPRKEHHSLKLEISAVETKANDTAKELKTFSFEQFEKRLFRQTGNGESVFYHYQVAIEKLKSNNQFGTASNYQLSLKSLSDFVTYKSGKKPKDLVFGEVTSEWLEKYEKFMLDILNRSHTTVSMYVRALRTVFNNAIQEGEIDLELYPFGKKKYQVPAVKNVKKALNKDHLKALFEATPRTPEQQKAKDFWFFSYASNGMNIKDIALLRWKDLEGDTLNFYRAKTLKTSKGDLTPITIYLNEFSQGVIEKYGSKTRNPKDLIFSIIDLNTEKEIQHLAVKNFTRFVNQNFGKLAIDAGLEQKISTYWARHSFATSAIRNGESYEFVSEALGHSDMKTTKAYFKGFEENAKREFSKRQMEF
jgi:integrase/recombinase XerD